MILDRFKLSWIFIAGAMGLVFVKIYQHNLIIKLNYQTQRLDKQRAKLENERNELYMELLRLHDPEKVFAKVSQQGLGPLKLNQVITMTHNAAAVDFIGTSSGQQVLKKLGLYDLVVGNTGRNHAGTRL